MRQLSVSDTTRDAGKGSPQDDPAPYLARLRATVRPALTLLLVTTLITGVGFPLVLTGLAWTLFPHQAHGSLVVRDGRVTGSELIGQAFADPAYFWGRPSATAPAPNNAAASTGSNLGPANPALRKAVELRADALRAADPGNAQPIPVDLVTASASGIDPDISIAAARYQVARVAKARHLAPADVQALLDRQTIPRQFGVLGEPRVNVLALNLALDTLAGKRR